jgi:transposase
MVRTDAPWRDLPEMFGNWNTVFRRFRRWARTSVFEHVFAYSCYGYRRLTPLARNLPTPVTMQYPH